MRTLTTLLAVAALAACGSSKGDDSTSPSTGSATGAGTGAATGTGTGAATGTGTGTATGTSGAEDCDDGVDNDGDGLLDCEDDDCAADVACFEADCADTNDNDGDGLVDCADEDCWGNGCEVTIATLTGMGNLLAQQITRYSSGFGGPSCNTSSSMTTVDIQLLSPVGTVRHMPASGTAWTTCSWAAASTTFHATGYLSSVGAVPVGRNGFTIDPVCPIQTSGFLPAWWRVQTGSPVRFRTLPTGNGPVWFTLNASTSYVQNSFSNSTVIAGSPCSLHQYSYVYSGTWQAVSPGADYTLVNP